MQPAVHAIQDGTLSKRLAASAAACVAVDVKGRAVVELQKDAVTLGQNGDFVLRFKTGLLVPMFERFVATIRWKIPVDPTVLRFFPHLELPTPLILRH